MARTTATPDVVRTGDDRAQALGNVSGAVAIDLSLGLAVSLTLTGDATLSFTNWPSSAWHSRLILYVTQGGTGGHRITWPAEVSWGTAGAPVLSAAGFTDAFVLSSIGGAVVFGFITGYGF